MTAFRALGLPSGQSGRALAGAAPGQRARRTGEATAGRVMTIAPGSGGPAPAVATTVLTAANLVQDEPSKTPAQPPPQRLPAAQAAPEGGRR